MAKKATGLQGEALERKNAYIAAFSKESQEIRDAIAAELPAYNELLSITGVTSFHELALQAIAKQRGVPYNKNKPEKPPCPKCGKYDRVIKKGDLFRCKECGKERFAATRGTLVFDAKRDAVTWMKALQCILNGFGATKTSKFCNFYPNTYYNILKHFVYCMELILMQDLRLYGNIQVDITFVPVSYKGEHFMDEEYPEDSVFYDDSPKPERESRKRGGAYSQLDWDANHIAIFTAIDDRSHAFVWGCGLGKCTWLTLKKYVTGELFLPCVPETDPFGALMKKSAHEPESVPGAATRFITDKEGAISKFITSMGYSPESHVYRRNGTQLKLGKETPHIQAANALHHRLKKYLRDIGYVSAKLLPAYLMLFNFIENTKASNAAVDRLFNTLTSPGLWQPSEFFSKRYELPNYIVQRLAAGTKITGLGPRRLTAYRLYDRYKRPKDYPNMKIPSMKEIVECTHYTEPSIRRIYRTLNKEGLGPKILEYYGDALSTKAKERSKKERVHRIYRWVSRRMPTEEETMMMFDEYERIRRLPPGQRLSFFSFTQSMNRKFQTDIKPSTLRSRFERIELQTGRKLPPIVEEGLVYRGKPVPSIVPIVYEEYCAFVSRFEGQDKDSLEQQKAYIAIGKRHGLAPHTVATYVSFGRNMYGEDPLQHREKKTYKDDEYINLYEEWAAILLRPNAERITFADFVRQVNARDGKKYNTRQLKKKFKKIQEKKLCTPLPTPTDEANYVHGRRISPKMLAIHEEYIELCVSYQQRGEEPDNDVIYAQLGEKYGVAAKTIPPYLDSVRVYKRKLGEKANNG